MYPDDSEANYLFKAKVEHVIKKRGLTVQEAASLLNISSERLYKYLNQGVPNPFPAYVVPLFALRIDPELLYEINRHAHIVGIPLPQALPEESEDFQELAAQIMRAHAGVIDLCSLLVKGEDVTPEQLRDIKRAVRKGISALLGVQLVAESMVKISTTNP